MDQITNTNDDMIRDLVKQEKIFYNVKALNEFAKSFNDIIFYCNIRSLSKNYDKLQVFMENLETKPKIIVCTETRVLEYFNFFKLTGYKIYYNNSDINITDGVVIYIHETVDEHTVIIKEGRLSILNTIINLNNNDKLVISALYRAHDIPKIEFIRELKNYITNTKKKTKII